jgi:hypothetical protein
MTSIFCIFGDFDIVDSKIFNVDLYCHCQLSLDLNCNVILSLALLV